MAPSLLSFAVAVLLLRTADAACNPADPVSALTYGCCLQANSIAEVWVDSGVATDGTPTNTAGVDNSNCGSTAAPCLSIKWAYHVRVANGGTVKVKGGRKYTGANNRALRDATNGAIALAVVGDTNACTRGSANVAGESATNRPVIDLQHQDRFIGIGGWTDPTGLKGLLLPNGNPAGWNGYGASITLSNLYFKRGKAPDPTTPVNEGWTIIGQAVPFYLGFGQNYVPRNLAATDRMRCNNTANPCPAQRNPIGCGGVISVIDATLVVHNCDFVEGFALLGGAICNFAAALTITGDKKVYPSNLAATACQSPTIYGVSPTDCQRAPHKLPGLQQHTDYQALQYEPGTASYCNFERNLAWGPESNTHAQQTRGAGGAIFIGNLVAAGIPGAPALTITGCNFFRQLAWHPGTGSMGNGGVIASLHLPNFQFKVTNTSFYENWAERGSVFFTGDSRDGMGSPDGMSMSSMQATWDGVTAVRNGYWDQMALEGCPKQYASYGCAEFVQCLGSACGANENPRWGGMRGVFQDTGLATAWNFLPQPDSNPEGLYNGQLRLDPLHGYACQGFDAYVDGGYPGSQFVPNRYPAEYYQNCGSPGIYTTLLFNLAPYGGSNIQGYISVHGGVWYSYGIKGLQFTAKRSTFIQNAAVNKGGVFLFSDGYFTLTGAITFEDCKFIRNRAKMGAGINAAIVAPSAAYARIGAASAMPNSKVKVVRSQFKANIALQFGGAISMESPITGILGTTIDGYNATELNVNIRGPGGAADCGLIQSGANQFDPATTACPKLAMKAFPTRFPDGTRYKLEVAGTPTGNDQSVTSANADSKFTYNMAGVEGGVFYMGSETNGAATPNMHVGADFVASDTYLGHNGIRMTDISPYGVVGTGKGGGVIALHNDIRRGRSVSCYPIPNTTNPFQCTDSHGGDGCPEGRRGKCKCFDACAYELYQVLAAPSFAAGMATVFEYELDHKITFTRCGIEGNIAHNNGGVVATSQVLRDAATILFDRCSISRNGAFGKGGVVSVGAKANSKGAYPQSADIAMGKDNFVGSVEVRNSTLTQNGAGLAGGAFSLEVEHNFIMKDSTSIGGFASKALKTTGPLHGGTPGKPLHQFDWWAAMPLWTCGGDQCRGISSEYGGPGGDYGLLTKTETALLLDISLVETIGGFLYLSSPDGLSDGSVKSQVTVVDSTISRATASKGGAFAIYASGVDTAACKYGTDCSKIRLSRNSLTASGSWAKDAFKCDGATSYSWTSGDRTSDMVTPGSQLVGTPAGGIQHSGSASKCSNHALLQRSTVSENMALRAKSGGISWGGVANLVKYLQFEMRGVTATGNLAANIGGVVAAGSPGTKALFLADPAMGRRTMLFDNKAEDESSSVWFLQYDSIASLSDTTIYGNQLTKGITGSLAEMYDSSEAHITNCIIRHNFAATYGGIRLKLKSKLFVKNTVFQHNVAAHYASVLYTDGDTQANFDNCTFNRNKAFGYDQRGGGVMMVTERSNVTITGSTFINNYARYYGGAIQVRGGPRIRISASKFQSNTASHAGGAIFVEHNTGGVWNQTTLEASPAALYPRPNVVISNTEFDQNTANENGGALGLFNSLVQCIQCTGTNNTALQGGGFAALLHTNASLVMTDSTISHNTAQMSGGAFFSIAIQEGDLRRATEWSVDPGQMSKQTLIGVAGGNGGRLRLQQTKVTNNRATLFKESKMIEDPPSCTSVYWSLGPATMSPSHCSKMTGHGGAMAFWYWPQTPSIDAWSATRMRGNQAGGGGVAFLLDRSGSQPFALEDYAARLVQPSPAKTALDTLQDNPALYGLKLAASGAKVKLSRERSGYKFSPGLLFNPSTVHTTLAPDGVGLELNATFLDNFNQTVATCDDLICLAFGNAAEAPKVQMAGGTRKLVSQDGSMLYEGLRLTGFFNSSTTVSIECALDESSILTMKESLRIFQTPHVGEQVFTDDCKEGWFPVISERVLGWVRICAPCNPGFFSPAINSQCYACPQAATSDKGAFGIQPKINDNLGKYDGGCFCEVGQYIDYDAYTGVPDDAKAMKCIECEDGEQCSGKNYPVPKVESWFYKEGGSVYECVFEGACHGFTETFGSESECFDTSSTCYARNPVSVAAMRPNNTAVVNYQAVIASHTTNTRRTSVVDWDAVTNMLCVEGYQGVLCAVCWDDWQLTDSGCQECGGSGMKVLMTWLGLIVAGLFTVPIVIFMIKNHFDRKRAEAEAEEAEAEAAAAEAQAEAEAEQEDKATGRSNRRMDSQGAALIGAAQNYQMNTDLQAAASGDNDPPEDEGDEEDEEEEEEMDSDDEFLDDELGEELEDTAETEQDGDVEEGNIDGLIDTLSSQLKGIMSHFQVMGSFTVSVDVQWPSAFGDFCSGFSFMSLDLNSLFAMGCVASTNYFGNIMVTFLLPTVCFPGIFLAAVICNKLFGLEKELVKNKAWLAALYLMFLIYPNCCAVFLSTFWCHHVEGTDYLRMDYSLKCYDSDWVIYAGISIAGICFYCIGIPLMDYIILIQNQHKLFISEKFEGRFGFIYGRFSEEYFYWELVEMLRKFSMGGLLMFVKSGTYEQVIVGIFMAGAFLLLQFRFRPFADDVDNNLAIVGGISTVCTMLMAVLVKSGNTGSGVNMIIMVVNLGVLACSMYAIFFSVIPDWIEDQEKKIRRTLYFAGKMKKRALAIQAAREEAALAKADKQSTKKEANKDAGFSKAEDAPDPKPESEADSEEDPQEPDEEPEEVPDQGINQEELRETQLKYFNRYDLDGSKTINSAEELMQLCTNLTVKLNLKVRIADLQALVDENDLDAEEWDFEEFKEWFDEIILPHRP